MEITYSPWSELYWDLFEYEGDAWNDDVLLPWAEANQPSVRELSLIGYADARRAVIPREPMYTPLQALYVLSRILDVLVSRISCRCMLRLTRRRRRGMSSF